MVEQFTSIIPCHFSLESNNKPDPCTLVIDVNKNAVQFTLYYFYYGMMQKKDFNYKEYDTITLCPHGCAFEVDQDTEKNAFFYFLNNENDFKRFIFILAESGMIIPQIINQSNGNSLVNQQQFTFLKTHSFIPEGKYNYVNPSIIVNIKKILKNRVKKIKSNEFFPLNKDYYKLVFPFVHKIEERKIMQLKIKNKNKISDSIPSPDQLTLIKKLVSRSGYNKQEYKQLVKEMTKNQEKEKYKKYFQMIKSDCQDINKLSSNFSSSFYQERCSKQLILTCYNVCKLYIVSNDVEYNKNTFFIALKIALLLIGGERIKNFVECSFAGDSKSEMNSITKSIPSLVKKISENESDFEGLVYFIFSFLMKPLTIKATDLIKDSYVYLMSSLESLIPYSGAYFSLKKIESFNFLEKDVKELFLLTFKSPWIAWFFIMRTNDPDLAVESILASIVYFLVPPLVEENIDIKDYWPDFAQKLQNDTDLVKDVIDTATCFYFYHKTEVENSLL